MKKVVLCILDGLGYREESFGNAFLEAGALAINKLLKEFPNSKLLASGEAVGLPDGQMGNSEVGHMTIGTGRVLMQPLNVINKAISSGSFYTNAEFLKVIDFVKENKSRLHIFGLLSDGGVHSHISHIFALIDMAMEHGVETYIHVVLDGRDVLYDSALSYLDELSSYISDKNCYIATISGRYYAMDREGVWDRTELCYNAIFNGIGPFNDDYKSIIATSYDLEIYDEFVVPTIVNRNGIFCDGDGMIIANFRPDRLNQLFSVVTDSSSAVFEVNHYSNIKCVSMMPISDKVKCPFAFPHNVVNKSLGEVLSLNGLRVLRIAETSKYPHVTHFFDGDRDVSFKGTSKICIPRKRVDTYDMEPSMSACEITDKVISVMNDYDFIVMNYANCDMVGHTGNYGAAVKAVSAVDKCVMNLYEACFNNDYLLVICADHGNVEEMIRDGKPMTMHTTNPVYFIVCDKAYRVRNGSLSDIAPSLLSVLGMDIPDEMTGNIIIY